MPHCHRKFRPLPVHESSQFIAVSGLPGKSCRSVDAVGSE